MNERQEPVREETVFDVPQNNSILSNDKKINTSRVLSRAKDEPKPKEEPSIIDQSDEESNEFWHIEQDNDFRFNSVIYNKTPQPRYNAEALVGRKVTAGPPSFLSKSQAPISS